MSFNQLVKVRKMERKGALQKHPISKTLSWKWEFLKWGLQLSLGQDSHTQKGPYSKKSTIERQQFFKFCEFKH